MRDEEQLRADAARDSREDRIMQINLDRLSRVNTATENPPVLIGEDEQEGEDDEELED